MWGRHLVCQFGRHPAARNTGRGRPVNWRAGSLPYIFRQALSEKMAEQCAYSDGAAWLGPVWRDAEDTAVGRLDFLKSFVTVEGEERFAGTNGFAVLFQPADERAFLHCPSEPRNCDFNGHVQESGVRKQSL